MDDREQLAWEKANARWAAPAAYAAGALILLGFLVPPLLGGGQPDNEREALVRIHEHAGTFLASAVLQSVAYFALAAVFFYLMKAIGARRAEALAYLRPVVFAAPVLLLVGLVLTQLNIADVADRFVAGEQTVDRAKDLIDDRSQAAAIVTTLGTLLLALSFVLVCVNAMRAGLFSRFTGFVGFIAGALLVLPILPGAIIQSFWAVSVGVLILDRWPRERGPAWSTVEAIPWPTATDAARAAEAPADPPPPAPEAEPVRHENPRAARKKKKRKRR